jgi:hypothetical protein
VLLADPEALDHLGVAVRVLALETVEETAALAYELEEAPARVVVLRVRLEVLGEVADSLAEERDLDLGGSGIAFVGLVRADNFGLTFLAEHEGSFHARPRKMTRHAPHQAAVVRYF